MKSNIMASSSKSYHRDRTDVSVYELITELCHRTASKCTQNHISQRRLASKMRSYSYEIILKKTSKEFVSHKRDPVADLLTHQFIMQQKAKNVVEYKRMVELKNIICDIRKTSFGDAKENIYNVLWLLVGLSNNIKEDLSAEIYKNPFTYGWFDNMLPKPEVVPYGSPQPYAYYPSHVFDLPFSLKHEAEILYQQNSQIYTEYTVESYVSKSLLPGISKEIEIRTFLSPMSLPSMTSTHYSPYSDIVSQNAMRLLEPRNLKIPGSDSGNNMEVSLASSNDCNISSVVKEVYIAPTDSDSVDIWELASQLDKEVPDDIWDYVSKLPPINERQLIASSSRELCLWRKKYGGEMNDLNIISERQFIRHIMYLIIGVETSSFPFSKEENCFYMKNDLIIECFSKELIVGYVPSLLTIGTYYRRLYNFGFKQTVDDDESNGLVYEAAREVIRRYLLEFRLKATEIYEERCSNNIEEVNCMPTLLQIMYHLEPLQYEIETIATIYKMVGVETAAMPRGAELMSYLFNEISLVTHKKTAYTMFNSLFNICKVYYKFIERFIFEGELDDRFNEFFIRKDTQYVNCRTKRYWDKGFHISQSQAIPEYLRALAKLILLCGKSLRLLKLCNPCDPLVLLISSDHPSVKCCANFEELERQQQLLDVYRTRCLFVSGEPVSFAQILLKREAEKKAFTEMASVKQAETMEKIIAERKRLAQLIIAEKQHSLKVLEAAMAQAKLAKKKAKERERKKNQLESVADAAREEVDSKLRHDERNKIMEYYSKLNMVVEKSKIHTEWKIKRLQLDQSRIQLLSTEERNLKREKLELEHQRNEEIMAMSLQSLDSRPDDDKNFKNDGCSDHGIQTVSVEAQNDNPSIVESNQAGNVFSAICNAAKSIFSVSWSGDNNNCDNKKNIDSQGNIVIEICDDNVNANKKTKKDPGETGDDYDNKEYFRNRQEAELNRKRAMSHTTMESIDKENNPLQLQLRNDEKVIDFENNVDNYWTPFEEAKRNKLKVLTADFDVIANNEDITVLPKADAQKEDLTPFEEAKRNRTKVLTEDFGKITNDEGNTAVLPRTDAQKEALLNKIKVLGVEYNIPSEIPAAKQPMNCAQEEAILNRNKVLSSEYELRMKESSRLDRKSFLTLDLKKPSVITSSATYTEGVTPNTGLITPAEFFPRLDLETPTAEIPLEGPIASENLTSLNAADKKVDPRKTKSEKQFLTSEGFDFSIIDDEVNEIEDVSETKLEDTNTSPSKSDSSEIKETKSYSYFSLLDGSYNFDTFDPFGVKDLKQYSKNHFTSKMDSEESNFCYLHPSVIMDEVKKSPHSNVLVSNFIPDKEQSITCDNIATLTACLQRSVLLPLTYQLEVVNNAILAHYLVNLDMYEHLRSLKDYFFLMDGEFSRSICRNLFAKLEKTINPQELLNFATLHNILDKALGSSISHVHKFSENLSFIISEPPLSFQHSSPDVLQCLSLTYIVNWPLNIILSQEALLRYAKVFQFLVKMRRVSWVLGEQFETLKLTAKFSKQSPRRLKKSPHYITIQVYRHIMASMIRALDNYIVTTCILTSWTEFENDLKKARTLDDLYDCHVVYLKKVLFRCLLNNRSTPVMKLFNDIFTVILKFSRVLKAGEWLQKSPNENFTHSNFPQLQELFHLFEKLNKYLHKVVSKLMECGYQRHLVELLTMVNFNGYYDSEKSKEETNTSV